MHMLHRFIARQLGKPEGAFGYWVMPLILARGNGSLNRWVNQLLAIRSGERVLDLGCGPGVALGQAAGQLSGGLAVGADFSAEMVQQARLRNWAAIHKHTAGIVRADAHCLPFATTTFDLIYAVNVIYFWHDAPGVLREAHRVLRPGGRLAIAIRPKTRIHDLPFTRYGLHLYEEDALISLFNEAGFTQVRATLQPQARGLGGLCVVGQRESGVYVHHGDSCSGGYISTNHCQ